MSCRLPSTFKILVFCMLVIGPMRISAVTNGVALTPPMGWNSWYGHGLGLDENLIRSTADQMATNGMKAIGYQYINMDDGWMGTRDSNGVMMADPMRFPGGIKALADYVHSKGLKFGLYTTGSTNTCGYFNGSYGYEIQDANTYAAWGMDYVKYELCTQPWYEDWPHQQQCVARMALALRATGRPMVFSFSVINVEPWTTNFINVPRATGDLAHTWENVLAHFDTVAQFAAYAGPGQWNDPDVLDIGAGANFTDAQNKAIFSMACVLASPLITANVSDYYTNIFCNADAIAVDQDAAGIQGTCVASNGNLQVWCKPLGGPNSTNVAVVLLNRGTNAGTITANWSDLGLPTGVAGVRDLWAHAFAGFFTNGYSATIPPQSAQFLKITAGATPPALAVGTNFLSDLPWMTNVSFTLPFQLDQSGAMSTISRDLVPFTKGIGTAGNTCLTYALGGFGSHFLCALGIDDAAGAAGMADFQVYGDGILLYDSGVLTASNATRNIDVDVRGRNQLTLLTTAYGATNNFADWAGARVIVEAAPASLGQQTVGAMISLSWTPAPGALSYQVYRSNSSGGIFNEIGAAASTAFIDTNVMSQATYYYQVAAVTSSGLTTNSFTISAMLTPHWLNTVTGAAQSWNAASNWSNAHTFPDTAGWTAGVDSPIAAGQSIVLGQPITVGSLWVGSPTGAGAFTISGNGGNLIFDNQPASSVLLELPGSDGDVLAAPVTLSSALNVTNQSTNVLTLSGPISGPGQLTICAGGPVTLAGTNAFSAPVTVSQSRLMAGSPGAFNGAQGGVSVGYGATLDINGMNLGAGPVTVAGMGTDGAGALVNNSTNGQVNALQSVTLVENTAVGGLSRWDIRGANPGTPSATLSSSSLPLALSKLGPNQVSIADVAVDPMLGEINVLQGILEFEGATTSCGNPANLLSISPGATLSLGGTTNIWSKQFALNGDGVTPSISNFSGSNVLVGAVTLAGSGVVTVNAGSLGFSGPVHGVGGLTKTGGGVLVFAGTNDYVGDTIVSAGTLALTGKASITNSSNINVAAGALLDTGTLAGGMMTIASGQTLTGAGAINGNVTVGAGARVTTSVPLGMLNFNRSLTLASDATCTLAVSRNPQSSARLVAGGTLSFGGALVVGNIGGQPFQSGDSFQLFRAPDYTGRFSTIAPLVPGAGLVWDDSQLTVNGTLRVTNGSLPNITGTRAVAGGMAIFGTGGLPGGTYLLLGTTNPAKPVAQWLPIATNQFDAGGNFNFTNFFNSNIPAQYFRIEPW